MESRLESARLLTYKAAALKDKKLPYTKVSGLIFWKSYLCIRVVIKKRQIVKVKDVKDDDDVM